MSCPEGFFDYKFKQEQATSNGSTSFFCNNPAKDWNFYSYLQQTHNELDKSKLTRIRLILNHFKDDLRYLSKSPQAPETIKLFLKTLLKSYKLSDKEIFSRYISSNNINSNNINSNNNNARIQDITISNSRFILKNYQSGSKRPFPFGGASGELENEVDDDDTDNNDDADNDDDEDDDGETRALSLFEKWVYFVDQAKKGADIRPFSPVAYNIIRCGNGISSRPDYPKELYDDHVKNHQDQHKYTFAGKHANYIDSIIDSKNLIEFTTHIDANEEDGENKEEYLFLKSFFHIMRKIYKSNVPMTSSESIYNYYAIYPMIELICDSLNESGGCGFLPGEAPLNAMRNINGTDKNEYDYLADAIVKSYSFDELEIFFLETSGPYKNTDKTKINFDNHKAMFGALALLKKIGEIYNYATIEVFYDLKVFFLQASNMNLSLWSLRFVKEGVYEMWREERVVLDLSFKKRESLVGVYRFLWNMRGLLNDSLVTISALKDNHNQVKRENRHSSSQPTLLTDFINPMIEKITQRKHSKGMSKYGPFSSPEHD